MATRTEDSRAFLAQINLAKGHLGVAFDSLPDIPLSRVILTLAGGRRGILVNSRSLCRGIGAVTGRLAFSISRVLPPVVLAPQAGRRSYGSPCHSHPASHRLAALLYVVDPIEPRTFEMMIAALALADDLPVHTCNPDDFEGIDGLRVVAVPVPSEH